MTITMPEYQKRILREAADLLALYCQEAERENAALKREADDWAVMAGECAGSEAELREAVAELTVLRDRQERREQQWRLASGLRRRLADAGKECC